MESSYIFDDLNLYVTSTNIYKSNNSRINNSQEQLEISCAIAIYDYFLSKIHITEKNK